MNRPISVRPIRSALGGSFRNHLRSGSWAEITGINESLDLKAYVFRRTTSPTFSSTEWESKPLVRAHRRTASLATEAAFALELV